MIVHPVTGQPLKLGRNASPPAAERRMHLPLRRYVRGQLPKPPTQTQHSLKARACLQQVMLNDTLSDCTAAAAFHIEGSWMGNAVKPVTYTDAQIEDFYARSTGYVIGNPATDQGGDEITVLDCWRTQGLIAQSDTAWGHRKILGHLVVDATNVEEMQLAIWLFLNLYFGVALPDDWVGKFMPHADGAVWPVAGPPNPQQGHAFAGIDYTPEGVIVCTWGMLVLIPWTAIAKYAVASAGGELHVAVSLDMLDRVTHKAPSGFDIDACKADFAAVAA